MASLWRSITGQSDNPNVYNWEDLLKISDPSECGHIIVLKSVSSQKDFEKLVQILAQSKLKTVSLPACFPSASQTLKVVGAISRNGISKGIHLDLQGNEHNDDCVAVLVHLINKKIVTSLDCPNNMDGANTERLLEIVSMKETMRHLNLNGSVLNENSLKYLKDILLERKIKKSLNMSNCQRTSDASLTSEDFERLNKAERKGRSVFTRNLMITWFPYVGKIDEYRLNSGFNFLFNETIDYFFNKNTGKKCGSAMELVRFNNIDKWQILKPGTKRKKAEEKLSESKQTTGMKRQKKGGDNDVDALMEDFANFGQGIGSLQNKADREENGVVVDPSGPSYSRCFGSSPSSPMGGPMSLSGIPPHRIEQAIHLIHSAQNQPQQSGMPGITQDIAPEIPEDFPAPGGLSRALSTSIRDNLAATGLGGDNPNYTYVGNLQIQYVKRDDIRVTNSQVGDHSLNRNVRGHDVAGTSQQGNLAGNDILPRDSQSTSNRNIQSSRPAEREDQ